MPTPLMDSKGLSSPSHISEDVCFSSEAQDPSRKTAPLPDQYGAVGDKAYASSPLQKFVKLGPQMARSVNHTDPFVVHDQQKGISLHQHALQNGPGSASGESLSLIRSVDHNSGSISNLNGLRTSYYAQGNNAMRPQYENSLFSSSVPELFSRKLTLSPDNAHLDHSVGNFASGHGEGDMFALPEEIEAQTIGNLLPDDDDLFSGVTEGLDFAKQPNNDDPEELDFFSNVGGLELGETETSAKQKYLKSSSDGSVVVEHSFGHILSRTLFVRNINSDAEDSELQTLFKRYGDICNLFMDGKPRGFIMVSYYDIRAAQKAMENLQNQVMMGRKLDIHYSVSNDNPSQRDISHGMLVLYYVDHAISNVELHRIFGVYGDIKQIQNIPYRNHQRLVEFYDIRDAEAAFHALNNSSIAGKQIKLEPIQPGRLKDLLKFRGVREQDEQDLFLQQSTQSYHSASGFPGCSSLGMDNGSAAGTGIPFLQSSLQNGISSSVPNGLASLLRVESRGNKSGLSELGNLQAQRKFHMHDSTNFHPHSLPDYQDSLINGIHCNSPSLVGTNLNSRPETMDARQLQRVSSNGHSVEQGVFGSAGSGSSPLLRHHMWSGNSYRSQVPSMMWPNSPSFVNGIQTSHPSARLQGLHGTPPQLLSTVLPTHAQNHHFGSAPAINPTLWEKQQSYTVGSPDTTGLHPGSLGAMRISKNSFHSMDLVPHNIFPNINGNCMDLPIPSSNIVGHQSPHQRYMMYPGRGPMMPSVGSFDSPGERIRSRRNEGSSTQADKKQYELDVERIIRGEDNRTTLMIKNIPNKYTSKMLLATIDDNHKGTYDFIYLPIDFKNKCNVGYAFINMTDPGQIIPFYKAFNGKKWEKFNSEKVATLAYARIQGKAALIAHFQNSSLMNEDKRCRPILFNTEGPNAGDQVPFPMGINVRSRPGKARNSFLEENHQGSPPSAASGGGEFSNGGDVVSD